MFALFGTDRSWMLSMLSFRSQNNNPLRFIMWLALWGALLMPTFSLRGQISSSLLAYCWSLVFLNALISLLRLLHKIPASSVLCVTSTSSWKHPWSCKSPSWLKTWAFSWPVRVLLLFSFYVVFISTASSVKTFAFCVTSPMGVRFA